MVKHIYASDVLLILDLPQLHFSSWFMDRPLAIGGFSGLASTLAYNLLRSLLQVRPDHPGIEASSVPLDLPVFDCPDWQLTREDIPWYTFAAGVGVGLLIGPTIDFLWLLRHRWRRFIWRITVQEQTGAQRLHKVVA